VRHRLQSGLEPGSGERPVVAGRASAELRMELGHDVVHGVGISLPHTRKKRRQGVTPVGPFKAPDEPTFARASALKPPFPKTHHHPGNGKAPTARHAARP